jgi:hypothetical protein
VWDHLILVTADARARVVKGAANFPERYKSDAGGAGKESCTEKWAMGARSIAIFLGCDGATEQPNHGEFGQV